MRIYACINIPLWTAFVNFLDFYWIELESALSNFDYN